MKIIVFLLFFTSCSSTIIRDGRKVKEIFIKDIVSNIDELEVISKLNLLTETSISCSNSDLSSPSLNIPISSDTVTLPSVTGLFHCSLKGIEGRTNVVGEFNILITLPYTATIIVDIDNTITDANPIQFLLNDYKSIKQLPNASSSLNKITTKYQIIYLTARNEIFRDHTRNWLAHNSFPPGPVLYWNLTDYPFFDSKYKKQRISKLKQNLANIVFAVGDKNSDIFAYRANGLKTIIIREESTSLADVDFVRSWDEILKKYY